MTLFFLTKRDCSCGWGTWKKVWNKVDWNINNYGNLKNNKREQKAFNEGGIDLYAMLAKQMNKEIDSWAIRWCYDLFLKKQYALFPVVSYIHNIGFDNSGVHSGTNNFCENRENIIIAKNINLPKNPQLNKKILKQLKFIFAQKKYLLYKHYLKMFLIKIKVIKRWKYYN